MNKFSEILAKIEEYDKIIIHRHQSPDPDALGSQSGLALALRHAFPQKQVLMAGESVGDLDWITTMDNVADADYVGALVIVVDTANTPRISDQRFLQGAELIKIDHHPNDDSYGDMQYVDDQASSSSEIIAELIESSNGVLSLTADSAYALYAGIVGDTGRFLFSSTSASTFLMAQKLVETGINHNEISQNIQSVTFAQAKLQNAALDELTIDKSGAAYVVISQAKLQELGVDEEGANAVVSGPGRLKEVLAWLIFVEKANGSYRVHYRSKGPIVNELAKKHDGGGHALASGANAKDQTEVQQIIQELIEASAAYKKEKHGE